MSLLIKEMVWSGKECQYTVFSASSCLFTPTQRLSLPSLLHLLPLISLAKVSKVLRLNYFVIRFVYTNIVCFSQILECFSLRDYLLEFYHRITQARVSEKSFGPEP